MSPKNIIGLKKYYLSQERHHGQKPLNVRDKLASQLKKDTVDSWRHARMYSFIKPLINTGTWLTVGDGKFGKEAHYLESHGADVIASDIADVSLKKAKKMGFIKKYKKENAENLSFRDKSFDYVFCKESFHHFPRPTIALYEMLRVAREAVILIEPNDVKTRGFSWSRFCSVDRLGERVNKFEVSGNYVYSMSRRDVEKIGLGIGLPTIAFAGLDDVYIKGVEEELLSDKTYNFLKIKFILAILNIAYKLGLRDRSLLVSILFKEEPSKKTIKLLEKYGYNVHMLPKNPYIKQ